MYCSHFGLHRHPFNNTPDPSFYYSTPDHEEALATLEYATLNRKGFVLVTGEVGAGKTLIGRMFLRQIDRQASTAVITHTLLNGRQLLAAICGEFELPVSPDATNLQLAERLQSYLLDQFARDRFVVVLLDEAQNLPDEGFETLRMLGNLEADDAKLLQVCILGQPELRDRFKFPAMRQLDQRLFQRFHLAALTERQTIEYIQRRLSVAGSPRSDVLTTEALQSVYAGSQGIPRLINRICDNALLAAYAQGLDTVDNKIIRQVLEQDGLDQTCHAENPSAAEPPSPPTDEDIEARIDQIYNRPVDRISDESIESQQVLSDLDNRLPSQFPSGVSVEAVDSIRKAHAAAREETQAELARTRTNLETRITAATEQLNRLPEYLNQIRHDHQSLALEHAESSTDHERAIEDIFASVGRHEDEIRDLSQQATARFDALSAELDRLRAGALQTEDLDRLRDQHQTFAQDVLDRFASKADDLDRLRRELDELNTSSGQHGSAISDLNARLQSESDQLRQVRSRLTEDHAAIHERLAELDEQFVGRAEWEALRQAQADQSAKILDRVQAERQAVQKLMEELSARFQATHERLDGLAAAAKDDGDELAELRRIQADDVASLLRQLEDQRRMSQEQFEQTLTRWTTAQQEIELLRQSAADAGALEELRRNQSHQVEQMRQVVADQRQSLEDLIGAANRRCDELLARLEASPTDVVSAAEVQALRDEGRSSKAALETAVRSVAEQCDRTTSTVRTLEDRTACMTSDLQAIQQSHTQDLGEIVQRLESQSSEYQQEFDTLKQHWAELRAGLEDLAGSSTPVEKFEAAERVINRDLDALKHRLDRVTQRREKDVRKLVDVVQRLSDRVKRLEETDRPEPVRIELRPRAAEELAALNTEAQARTSGLTQLLADTQAVSGQVAESSSRIEQALQDWTEQSNHVQEQSDQLRASADTSAQILQALRKCHQAIESKLQSPAWHGQMRRGEELIARLEQVLPQYDSFEKRLQSWPQERLQADELIRRLEQMVAEAARATTRLGRVGALMAGVARRDGLAETLEAARRHDEQARPTRANGHRSPNRNPVQPVNWPKYRTHVQANAG